MISADNLSKPFLDLCQKSLQKPQEVTINSLLALDGLSENTLSNIQMIEGWFNAFNLEVIPTFQEGTFDQPRILKAKPLSRNIEESELKKIIEEGENFLNEFKSTLLFDLKREQNDPNASLNNLKSEEVLHSTLKTIAAFLNWEGGALIIGVSDNATIVGIEKDYCFLGQNKRDIDGWELELRNQINGKFYDGNIINQHIDVKFAQISRKTVAVIQVLPRKRLSFVRINSNSDYILYCRQGNSTRQIPIIEIEQFIERRNQIL